MVKKPDARSARTFVLLSFFAAAFVGILIWGATRDLERIAIWSGITFIVSIVSIATLSLLVKDDESNPDEPKLK